MEVGYPLPWRRKKTSTSGSRRSVICFFFPGQRMARLKKSGPSSGLSEKSISESRSASTRFQLVLDRFFVLFAFTMGCLSKRDDTNGLGSTFRKDHDGFAVSGPHEVMALRPPVILLPASAWSMPCSWHRSTNSVTPNVATRKEVFRQNRKQPR